MLTVFLLLVITFLSVEITLSPLRADKDGKIPPVQKGSFRVFWGITLFWQAVLLTLAVLIYIEMAGKFPVWRIWLLILSVLVTLLPTWITVYLLTQNGRHLGRPISHTLFYVSLPMFLSSLAMTLLCLLNGELFYEVSHSPFDGMMSFLGLGVAGVIAIMYFIQGTILFTLMREK